MPIFTPNVSIETETPTVEVEGLAPGQYRFQLVVEDEAGNRSQADTVSVTVEDLTPQVTGVSPNFGGPGDRVVITGTHFAPQPEKNEVSFNGVLATPVAATATTLTVVVPPAATTGAVSVRTSFGVGISPAPFIVPRSLVVDLRFQPVDLAFDAIKNEVWVIGTAAGSTSGGFAAVVDPRERRLQALIQLGAAPNAIALSPVVEFRIALVTNPRERTVSALHLDERRLITTLEVGATPSGVAISPDGRLGYVSCTRVAGSLVGNVAVIDLASLRVVRGIPVGVDPTQVVFSHNGREAFVSNFSEGTISVITVATQTVTDVVKLGDSAGPQGMAIAPKTYPVWVANSRSGSVSGIAADHSVTRTPIELTPGWIALSPEADQAFLPGTREKLLAVVALRETPPVARTVRLVGPGGEVKSITTTRDGRGVVILHPELNVLSILEMKTLNLQAVIPIPTEPNRCVTTDDSAFACVTCRTGSALAIVELSSVLP